MYSVLAPVDSDVARAESTAKTVIEQPWERDRVTVTVLHVVEEFDIADDSGGRVRSRDLLEFMDFPESVRVLESRLDENGIETRLQMEQGDPSDVILDVVREENLDHVVMSARKRSPVGKAVFGSVAQSVLLSLEQPVTIAMK